jgi:GTP-binding protein HflX
VGFIRDLPHKLVEAFEATLQEAADADLLLHVVDAASPQLDEQMAEVERVLAEIGAADVPQILVYNKCDLLEDSRQPRVPRDWLELPHGLRRARVFASAVSGDGLPTLRQAIAEQALAARHGDIAGSAGLAAAAGIAEALSSPPDNPTNTRTQPHA